MNEQSFWEKVDKNGPNGCWIWTAGLFSDGYGCFWGKRTHRFSWVLKNGPIPNELFVCHHCDVRTCVNPDHLFLGTNKDNIHDSMKKGRFYRAYGEGHGRSSFTEQPVRDVFLSNKSVKELADLYGVTSAAIRHIKNRVNWTSVTDDLEAVK